MVNSVQSDRIADLAATISGKNKTTGEGSMTEVQDRFLTLLVTQMKNQDPLNPMDNAQVTSQMAQLSTVTGINKVNATLQALSDSLASNQSLQAAGMIGHGVMLAGNALDLKSGSARAGLELPQSVQGLTISVLNRSGVEVQKIELGPQSAGLLHWDWDGKDKSGRTLADGAYRFDVMAVQNGVPVNVTKLQYGVVNSVTQGSKGVMLGVGSDPNVSLSSIKQIL